MVRPSVDNRDVTDNSRARQAAYDKCEAKMNCVIAWFELALRDGAVPDDFKCGK